MKTVLGILSGGSGSRLWPLSRKKFPKQFHDLSGSGQPMIVDTVDRLSALGDPVIVTGKHLESTTMTILHRMGRMDVSVLVEPSSKDTAAAIALLTKYALEQGDDTMVGVFPADHVIEHDDIFEYTVRKSLDTANEKQAVVTIGIVPHYAATSFGYLQLTDLDSEVKKVKTFIEKPNKEKAEELLRKGDVVWNAGMFIFPARVMKKLFEQYMPDMWSAILEADTEEELVQVFDAIEGKSIDYGIMEKAGNLLCIPAEFGWKDLGSWEDIVARKGSTDKLVQVHAQNGTFVHMHPMQKTAVIIGMDDVIVVDTPDALLVMKSGEGQNMKKAVQELKQESSTQLEEHRFEERPWGRFEVLLDTPSFKSKRLILLPGKKLSYQRHEKRKEHWTITKGKGVVLLNGVEKEVIAGDNVTIPPGMKHRLGNVSSEPLEWIEVQTGSYFGEDDIERFEDDFGRV